MKGCSIIYSEDELVWIKAHRRQPRSVSHSAFCEKFGRDDVSLTNYNALCKRKGWMTGRTGCFEKGHRPHTWRGAGHEMTCPKDGYVYMIVAEKNPHTGADTHRVLKHKYLWEKANGPLPEGMCLKCLDGDRTNTDPTNWEAIPRALLPRLNGRFGRDYDAAEPELKPTILAVAKLEHKAREAKKQ